MEIPEERLKVHLKQWWLEIFLNLGKINGHPDRWKPKDTEQLNINRVTTKHNRVGPQYLGVHIQGYGAIAYVILYMGLEHQKILASVRGLEQTSCQDTKGLLHN